ncbi:hypothetical protein ACIGO8_13850 [Streptomyces sp. NPDC053493]|uniref:hypothetical protein n=1 Tax=Streptomyces sp. NPDC053493 TaxID=3365705 RepID=UPI0037D94631
MGRMSAAKLRGLGLGAAVVIAVLVPIAASAGPSAEEPAPAAGSKAEAGSAGDAKPAKRGGLLSDLGVESSGPAGSPASSDHAADHAAGPPPAVSRCGPELASPDGVEAQTCVVTEGPDTWARTYYRNATGQELEAVLTLMAPGGRTVQVRCSIEARDEPGTCETPKERSRGAADRYSAVAEFAGAGEGASTPLLLRSGSNTTESNGS